MVEEGKRGPKEGKQSSGAVKVVTAFFALLTGLILAWMTMYLLSFLISIVIRTFFSSVETPAAVYEVAWAISFLIGFLVLIASTVKIYGFLNRNFDFDFLP